MKLRKFFCCCCCCCFKGERNNDNNNAGGAGGTEYVNRNNNIKVNENHQEPGIGNGFTNKAYEPVSDVKEGVREDEPSTEVERDREEDLPVKNPIQEISLLEEVEASMKQDNIQSLLIDGSIQPTEEKEQESMNETSLTLLEEESFEMKDEPTQEQLGGSNVQFNNGRLRNVTGHKKCTSYMVVLRKIASLLKKLDIIDAPGHLGSLEPTDDEKPIVDIVIAVPPESREATIEQPDPEASLVLTPVESITTTHIEVVKPNEHVETPVETSQNKISPGSNSVENIAFESSDEEEEDGDSVGQGLDVEDLMIARENLPALQEEFENLDRRMPTEKIYSPSASKKNRSSFHFPWPNRRVPLKKIGDDVDSDYINASYVKSLDKEITYINTQAPMTSTVVDFWRMIWEQNITVVVMATPLTFRGEERCIPYWPTDNLPRVFGGITTTMRWKDLKPDYVVMNLTVSNSNESRELTIFRYLSWPKNADIPASMSSILTFLLDVRERICTQEKKNLPLFHGSNAIGMGAVFVAIMQCILYYDSNKVVNIRKLVGFLRRCQAGAVQTFEQYKFIHDVLYSYANSTKR